MRFALHSASWTNLNIPNNELEAAVATGVETGSRGVDVDIHRRDLKFEQHFIEAISAARRAD
jgi:hypothetical protein